MPLGLAKTGLSYYQADEGGGGIVAGVFQAQLTTDVVSNEQYQGGTHTSFAGFNSNDEPVFVSVYTESGRNNIFTLMYTVQFDGSVSTGTKYTLASGSADLIFPGVTTERDYANMRQNQGSVDDAAVFVWRKLGVNIMYGRAATYDVDAMTMTFGTETDFNNDFAASGMTNIVYGGSSGITLVANRAGGNNNEIFYGKVLRSGTTLNTGLAPSSAQQIGGYEFSDLLGFDNNRIFSSQSANNRDRVRTVPAYWYGIGDTLVSSSIDIQEENETDTRSGSAMMNETDTYLNIRYETQQTPTNTQVEAGIITWNSGGTAPTITQTNTIEVNPVARGRLGAVNGVVDGEAYAFNYTGTGADIDLHKISISGTTITKDYTKTLSLSNLPNENPLNDNTMVRNSAGDDFMIIYGRNSSTGYPMATVVINPDDL